MIWPVASKKPPPESSNPVRRGSVQSVPSKKKGGGGGSLFCLVKAAPDQNSIGLRLARFQTCFMTEEPTHRSK
jgi:hypothetical protein